VHAKIGHQRRNADLSRSKPVTCTTYSPKVDRIFSAKLASQPQFS